MEPADVLIELYGRIPPLARRAVEGADSDLLARAPAAGTNPIGWLVWHLARVQDHHIAELADVDQIWVSGGWAQRFGLEPDPDNIGYGHTAEDVGSVRPDRPEVLIEYLEAVQERTMALLEALTPEDLDRIVDRRWDPPVTMGVRLISVADDSLQHLGQAAYLRGVFDA